MATQPFTNLARLADYAAQVPHIFPSEAALRWYLRQHGPALRRAGAFVQINRRILIDVEKFPKAALAIANTAA